MKYTVTIDKSGTTPFATLTETIPFTYAGSEEDPAGRLLAKVEILGVSHHLEAIAVTEVEEIHSVMGEGLDDSVQTADDSTFSDMLDNLDEAFGGDGKFHTCKIDGRDYALFLSPYRS